MDQNRTNQSISQIEVEFPYEGVENKVPPDDVIAYNELRSCSDLVRMFNSHALEIKPKYQRNVVWSSTDKTRFIDSVVKGLPIPSMCFSLDSKIQKWQVIDGLQRMDTIIQFLTNNDWVLSKLEDVDPKLSGRTVSDIKKKHPVIYSKVENFSIPITILRCDFKRSDHLEYIFTIFQRLNTGGLKLTNQEIRNAVYQGPFNDLLNECDDYEQWKQILKKEDEKKRDRMQTVELILRFFSFHDKYKDYKGRLASFLNDYMYSNRFLQVKEIVKKRELFNKVIQYIKRDLSEERAINKLSNVVFDALLFGIAKNIDDLMKINKEESLTKYDQLIHSPIFDTKNLLEGTLQRNKVIERLETSASLFHV